MSPERPDQTTDHPFRPNSWSLSTLKPERSLCSGLSGWSAGFTSQLLNRSAWFELEADTGRRLTKLCIQATHSSLYMTISYSNGLITNVASPPAEYISRRF
tara:strand:- start:303 stop:605 length:303 start_codon:yes stop_codon:yes gene_type:complete